jgi:two-component system chemotaxis response regulator CheB
MPADFKPLVLIGASAGGVTALRRLASELPADLQAPVAMVLHIGPHPSHLPELLQAAGPLPASHAHDGQLLRPGHLYVAPPDHHMLIDGPVLRLTRGPKEHHSRPAIDPLFRSGALSHGSSVVGVVLTGLLDDGTAGLQAIKECGGTAVVQAPEDAEEPSMPLSALKHVQVDHCVALKGMAALLVELTRRPPGPALQPPPKWLHEHDLALGKGDPMEHLEAIATPSTFVCPDCKGGLWTISGSRPIRFICHVGHSFTLQTLLHAQALATDEALWTAIRALQEKRLLFDKSAEALRSEGDDAQAQWSAQEARALQRQERLLRHLVEVPPPS